MIGGQSWFFLAAVLCGYMLYERIRFLSPKLRSTWVARARRPGASRRSCRGPSYAPKMMRDGSLVLLLMEVTPADGQPAFQDEESIIVREQSLPKVQAGNTIRVRF